MIKAIVLQIIILFDSFDTTMSELLLTPHFLLFCFFIAFFFCFLLIEMSCNLFWSLFPLHHLFPDPPHLPTHSTADLSLKKQIGK